MKYLKLISFFTFSIILNNYNIQGQTWDGSSVTDNDAWRCGVTAIGADPALLDPNYYARFFVSNMLLAGCGDFTADPGIMAHHESGQIGEKTEGKWIGIGRTLLQNDPALTHYGLRINWEGDYGIFSLDLNDETSIHEPHIKWGGAEREVQGNLHFDVMNASDDLYSEVMTLTPNAQLGINNTNPWANLDVNGTFRLVNGSQANGRILVSDGNGFGTWQNPSSDWTLTGNNSITNTNFIGTINAASFKIRTSNLERLEVNANGNVGIGMSNAGTRLQVAGNSMFTATANSNPTSAALIRGLNNFALPSTPEYTFWNDDQTGIFHPQHFAIAFSIGGSEKFRINQTTITTSNSFDATSYKENGVVLGTWNQSVNGLNLSTTKQVGISTTNPVEALQIGDRFVIHNGWNKVLGFNFYYDGTNDKRMVNDYSSGIYFLGDGGMSFRTADNLSAGSQIVWRNALNIANDGSIGIGTDPVSNYKLVVEGKIGAREVRITQTTPWPDFVFNQDYNLKPLEEQLDSIKAVKHLPGIESADVISAEGVNVASTISGLTKNIEELYLYIEQLNAKIKILESNR